MRLPLLLLALGVASPALAQLGPEGYHSPHRYATIGTRRTFYRPPLRVHISTNLGYYNGDITSRPTDQSYRPGLGIGLTRVKSPRISFTADLAAVRLKASDQFPERGLRFESTNTVLTAMARYNLWADKSLFAALSQQATPFVVFVETGVGAIVYDPKAYQNLNTLDPEPLEKYPGVAVILPVGVGATYHATERLYLTLDARYNFTSTDLLDDVSQRGNPDKKDAFGTLTLQVEYSLSRQKGKPLNRQD